MSPRLARHAPGPGPTRRPFRLCALLFGLLSAGCGEDPVEPDEELAFLVGSWEARRFYVEHALNPDIGGDLVSEEVGATFTLDVQPSGGYTAVLTFRQSVLVEIGEVELDGETIVFEVLEPCCKQNRGTWSYENGTFRFEGPTEFDFNFDGVLEPAVLEVTLVRE